MSLLPQKIFGHRESIKSLAQDIESANVAHAYLFAGPAHIGKFTVARWFAAELLTNGQSEKDARATKEQMEKLIHPDFLVMDQLWMEDKQENWDVIAQTSNVPQQHRAKKKARTNAISIDDVRMLQERLIETGSSRHVCCLIRSVERLQDAAANAFLKILEEPPSRVVFILTTEALHTLLPTLVSRTRSMLFRPLGSKDLLPLLSETAEDDRAFVLHLTQGAPGKMMRLLKDPDLLRQQKQTHTQAMRFWQNLSTHEHLKWLLTFAEKGADLDDLLLHLGLALRERLADEYHPTWTKAYLELLSGLDTNAHKGLLLEQFALAVRRS